MRNGRVVVGFLVPIRNGKTRRYHAGVLGRVKRHLLERFGGWTVRVAKGVWFNSRTNKIERDDSLDFEVAVPAREIGKVRRFMKEIKRLLGQEVIYLTIKGSAELV